MGRKSVARSKALFFFFKHSFDERSRYRSRVIAHTTRILNRARNNYSSIFFFFFFFFFFLFLYNELLIEDLWNYSSRNEFTYWTNERR